MSEYPMWRYFPSSSQPPPWVLELVGVVAQHREQIDSRDSGPDKKLDSDSVLKCLAKDLASIGYATEATKAKADKIRRPVLFGDLGRELVAYEIDAFHDENHIVLEIEAGRGRMGNALFRDMIRSALIVDVRFLAIGMALEYRYGSKPSLSNDYAWAAGEIGAIYASGQLHLPFEGVLLFGY